MGIRNFFKKSYLRYTTLKWTVGIADYDEEAILSPTKKLVIHWVKYRYSDGWFADPFILSATESHIYLLVEELRYSDNKGRISKLKINRTNWKLESVTPVLELPTHLSFPAYFRKNGKVFIYPESTKSGKLTLYEYNESTDECNISRDICLAPLADAAIWDFGNRKYIAATTSPLDNGRSLDLYPFPDENAESGCRPVINFKFRERIARNAGLPFSIAGKTYRPAQNCQKSYGECVIIQEIISEGDNLEFKEIKRFHSPLASHRIAFHTFNVFENKYIAVDAEGLRHGRLAQAIYLLRERLR